MDSQVEPSLVRRYAQTDDRNLIIKTVVGAAINSAIDKLKSVVIHRPVVNFHPKYPAPLSPSQGMCLGPLGLSDAAAAALPDEYWCLTTA